MFRNPRSKRLRFEEHGKNQQSYVAVISGGTVTIYGKASLELDTTGGGKGILFQMGSVLATENTDAENVATLAGHVTIIGGNISLDGATGVGRLIITGDLDLNGNLWATVDFGNGDADQIVATDVKLAGTLIIEKQGDYQANQTFTVINAGVGALNGTFGIVQAPPNENYNVNYTATELEIKT